MEINGRTMKFEVRVKPYNFRAICQTFSVSRFVERDVDLDLDSIRKAGERVDVVGSDANDSEHSAKKIRRSERADIAKKKAKLD